MAAYDPPTFHPSKLLVDFHDRPRSGPTEFSLEADYVSQLISTIVWTGVIATMLFLGGVTTWSAISCCGIGKQWIGTPRMSVCACITLWVLCVVTIVLSGAGLLTGAGFARGYNDGFTSWRHLADLLHKSAIASGNVANDAGRIETTEVRAEEALWRIEPNYANQTVTKYLLGLLDSGLQTLANGTTEVEKNATTITSDLNTLVNSMLGRSDSTTDDQVFADDDKTANNAPHGGFEHVGPQGAAPGALGPVLWVSIAWCLLAMITTVRMPICVLLNRFVLLAGLVLFPLLWVWAGLFMSLTSAAVDFCVNPDASMVSIATFDPASDFSDDAVHQPDPHAHDGRRMLSLLTRHLHEHHDHHPWLGAHDAVDAESWHHDHPPHHPHHGFKGARGVLRGFFQHMRDAVHEHEREHEQEHGHEHEHEHDHEHVREHAHDHAHHRPHLFGRLFGKHRHHAKNHAKQQQELGEHVYMRPGPHGPMEHKEPDPFSSNENLRETVLFYFDDCSASTDPSDGGKPNVTARGTYGRFSQMYAKLVELSAGAVEIETNLTTIYNDKLISQADYNVVNAETSLLPGLFGPAENDTLETLPPIACTPVRKDWVSLLDAACNEGVGTGLIPASGILTTVAVFSIALCCLSTCICATHPADISDDQLPPNVAGLVRLFGHGPAAPATASTAAVQEDDYRPLLSEH